MPISATVASIQNRMTGSVQQRRVAAAVIGLGGGGGAGGALAEAAGFGDIPAQGGHPGQDGQAVHDDSRHRAP